jgi:hypothetical protein
MTGACCVINPEFMIFAHIDKMKLFSACQPGLHLSYAAFLYPLFRLLH